MDDPADMVERVALGPTDLDKAAAARVALAVRLGQAVVRAPLGLPLCRGKPPRK